jgi:hypothetical protein
MARFFQRTFYLWIVVRVIMIILIVGKLVTEDYHDYQSRKTAGLACFYILLLIIILARDLTGREKAVKTSRLTGGISIIMSLIIISLYIFYTKDMHPLILSFGVMAMFLGLYDVMDIHRDESNY